MKPLKTTALALVFSLAASFATAFGAAAEEYQVALKNKGENGERNVFEPAFLKIEPGDSITFVPAMNGHNAASIKGMIPDGAEPFKGPISKPLTVTFDVPGIYGLRCVPHSGFGMVGLIVVGNGVSNLEAVKAKKLRGKTKARFEPLFAMLEGL